MPLSQIIVLTGQGERIPIDEAVHNDTHFPIFLEGLRLARGPLAGGLAVLELEQLAKGAIARASSEITTNSSPWGLKGADKTFVVNSGQEDGSISGIFYTRGGFRAVVVLKMMMRGLGIGANNTTVQKIKGLSSFEQSYLARYVGLLDLHWQILSWIQRVQNEYSSTEQGSPLPLVRQFPPLQPAILSGILQEDAKCLVGEGPSDTIICERTVLAGILEEGGRKIVCSSEFDESKRMVRKLLFQAFKT